LTVSAKAGLAKCNLFQNPAELCRYSPEQVIRSPTRAVNIRKQRHQKIYSCSLEAQNSYCYPGTLGENNTENPVMQYSGQKKPGNLFLKQAAAILAWERRCKLLHTTFVVMYTNP